MKYKYMTFFIIFVLFIVGISCVSAQNIDEIGNSSDDTISLDDDISTINIVENEVSTNVDREVICDNKATRDTYSWADFKSEVENMNINRIELNKGNIAPSSDSSNQISINHDINIIGGYGYYIGSDSWSSSTKYNYIPIITSGSNLNVKFENVTFQYLSDNILMKLMGNGNYTFKNCVFSNINATGSHQSVIWLNYGHALIENCSFINCNCSFGAVTNYYSSWGIDDITNYIEPQNNTNGTNSRNITIPIGTEILSSSWDVILGDNLNGTSVVAGNYILIPASHDLYCYNYITQDLVWNFTTEFGYFHELLVDGNIVYAPASWEALYIFNLTNGEFLTYSNIYQGSSLYKPVIYNNTLYISSEYGYGSNSNNWISMIKHDSDYYYYDSILELTNVSYGTPAILSQPYIYANTLYVNTIQGLIAYNLVDGTSHNISGTVGNPIIDANGNICILSNNGTAISLLNSNLELIASPTLDGTCNKLISDANGNIYSVDNNGYIYYATYTSSSITCSKTKFNINPVSSAMACYNGELYIGDNNGILWAFNTNALNQNLNKSLNWAFDAGSAIVGNIAIGNYGTVYIGTDNRHFYAIEH